MLRIKDIPTAVVCPACTPVLLAGEAIVVAEFLSCFDVPFGHNPDRAFGYHDFTVGVTGMIDVAGFVLEGLAVNIVMVVEFEDILIALI